MSPVTLILETLVADLVRSALGCSGTIEGRIFDSEGKVLKLRFQRAVQAKGCVAGMPKVTWA